MKHIIIITMIMIVWGCNVVAPEAVNLRGRWMSPDSTVLVLGGSDYQVNAQQWQESGQYRVNADSLYFSPKICKTKFRGDMVASPCQKSALKYRFSGDSLELTKHTLTIKYGRI